MCLYTYTKADVSSAKLVTRYSSLLMSFVAKKASVDRKGTVAFAPLAVRQQYIGIDEGRSVRDFLAFTFDSSFCSAEVSKRKCECGG